MPPVSEAPFDSSHHESALVCGQHGHGNPARTAQSADYFLWISAGPISTWRVKWRDGRKGAGALARAVGYRVPDDGGLHPFVIPPGQAVRMRCRSPAKRSFLGGAYPGVKISAARQARDDAKARLRQGTEFPACVSVTATSSADAFETIGASAYAAVATLDGQADVLAAWSPAVPDVGNLPVAGHNGAHGAGRAAQDRRASAIETAPGCASACRRCSFTLSPPDGDADPAGVVNCDGSAYKRTPEWRLPT